eukprot:15438056-Alexandrium_andersonii.AAC.1
MLRVSAPCGGPVLPCAGAPSLLCSGASERQAKADDGRGGAASRATPPPGSPPSAGPQHNDLGQTPIGRIIPRER